MLNTTDTRQVKSNSLLNNKLKQFQKLLLEILKIGSLDDLEEVFASPSIRQKITEKDFHRFWSGLQRSIPMWEIVEMVLSILRQDFPCSVIQKRILKILEKPPFAF